MNWACRCEVCAKANIRVKSGEWDTSRTGFPYAATELELLVREDRTVSEIARDLRRSYRSVVMKRHALRRSA